MSAVIVDRLDLSAQEFANATGWEIKPEGACKAEVCVPLGGSGGFDAMAAAKRLGMAVVEDQEASLWAFGPESLGGRALVSAEAPDLVLPDLEGKDVRLSTLRGQKVVLVAWAPY
jgi:AhpC/TSA family